MAVLLGVLSTGTSLGKTVYVDDAAGNDSWSGLCAAWDGGSCGPKKSIQAGLNAAISGDVVVVADGVYMGVGNRALSFGGKQLTLRSTSGPERCIIDCQDADRGFIFNGEGPAAVLEGFTVQNGVGIGGAIRLRACAATIRRCILRQNFGDPNGGAISVVNASAPIIDGCVIVDNRAELSGGAIHVNDAASNLTLIDCFISRNRAASVGGVGANGGIARMVNCTITDNFADGSVGGVGLYGCPAGTSITNSIIVGNASDGTANEVLVSSLGVPGTVAIDFCCIKGGLSSVILQNESTVTWGGANVVSDARFAFPGSFRLLADSPCIDAGTNSPPVALSAADIDGSLRIADGDGDAVAVVDIGAFENDRGGAKLAPSADRIEMSTWSGAPSAASYELKIRNVGGGTAAWQVQSDAPWLNVEPASGTTNSEIDTIRITASDAGYPTGLLLGWIEIIDAAATNSPRTIPVTLRIGNGLQVPAEYTTVQQAIDAAQTGDFVILADGVHGVPSEEGINLRGKSITLTSLNGAEHSIIEGFAGGRVIRVDDEETRETVIERLTIRGGEFGVSCWRSSPTVRHCRITGTQGGAGLITGGPESRGLVEFCDFDNHGWDSGTSGYGMRINGQPTIRDCRFRQIDGVCVEIGNSASPNLTVRLERCVFEDSMGTVVSTEGGSDLELVGCTVRDHVGIGVHNSIGSTVTIDRCTMTGFERREAILTACINVTQRSTMKVMNSIFSGNEGYAFYGTASQAVVEITNCTMVGNRFRPTSSSATGSGIILNSVEDLIIRNSVLRDNDYQGAPQVTLAGTSASVSNCDVKGSEAAFLLSNGATLDWGAGNIDAGSGFAFVQDFRLVGGSPLIDAGAGVTSDFDRDGNVRTLDGNGDGSAAVDIGAFEHDPLRSSIALSRDQLEFNAQEGGPDPTQQDVQIRNAGGGVLDWHAVPSVGWLEVTPSQGTATQVPSIITLRVRSEGLSHGVHECVLAIHNELAPNSPRTIDIHLSVNRTRHVPAEHGTIQTAVDASISGDVIVLADGTYTGPGNWRVDFKGRDLVLRSAGGPEACTIDGGQLHWGFRFENGESRAAVLDGLTIANVRNGLYGAAVSCIFASPTIRNCVIRDGDSTGTGQIGGVYAFGGSPLLENCSITRCSAPFRPGAVWGEGSDVVIADCDIRENSATSAATVFVNVGSLTLLNSRVSENSTTNSGPAVEVHGRLDARNCIIARNTTTDGGSSPLGGGIRVTAFAPSRILNCTIVQNTGARYGGGILASGGDLEITNCLIWGNSAQFGPQLALLSGAYANVRYSDVQGGDNATYKPDGSALDWVTANLDVDPLFLPDGEHLADSSPCRNMGDPQIVAGGLDIDRQARVWEDRVDIGADEIHSFDYSDLNCDGTVNTFDIEGFLIAIMDPARYPDVYPSCAAFLADSNANGTVNQFDIPAFIEALAR